MRAITKQREPHCLTEHRSGHNCDYGNFDGKDELRKALVQEQRGLCCYCMGRIRADINSMKIEHWHCQSQYPDEQLNYNNLLGACKGGEGRPRREQHCDTRKDDNDLKWNPATPSHRIEFRVRYELDGTIRSNNHEFDEQLKEVLNLNLPFLKNNRAAVLTGLLQWWKRAKPVNKIRIQQEISKRTGGTGNLKPYCQVAVWWLEQKL